MNHFTPELYQRFNSFDPEEAERADEEWDRAEATYKERLAAIRDRMPSAVRQLAGLSLHDADLLSWGEGEFVEEHASSRSFVGGPPRQALAIIDLRQGEEIVSLLYRLSDRIENRPAPLDWRFSKEQEHWLYDEVDEAPGGFIHRILLSSGVELSIPFISVLIRRFRLPVALVGKRSA